MKNNWLPLHVHTEYSALDGAIKIPAYYSYAQRYELPAAAVTDHGNMSSHVEVDKVFKDIKPIYGCETYAGSMLSNGETLKSRYHLNVFARTAKGYANLRKLVSSGYKADDESAQGPYYITRENIEQYSEGLIVSTACMSGELSVLLQAGMTDGAEAFADFMCRCIGKENFYVEVLDIAYPEQDKLNRLLMDFARKKGLNLIVTTDSHYMREDRYWYNALVAAQKKQIVLSEEERDAGADYDWEITGKMDLSLRDPDVIYNRWKDVCPEGLQNTLRFAESIEKISVKGTQYRLPQVHGSNNNFTNNNFTERAREGLRGKLREYGIPKEDVQGYEDRLNYELNVITKMDFVEYFSLVEDIVRHSKETGIKVGPGRGSAAGSILSWSLGITDIDPVKYGLIFERFLNPERIGMPDIDLDIEDERRGDVIAYLKKKYGETNVAGIINYSRSGWKMSIRDAARVLGCQPWQGDQLSKALEEKIDNEEVSKETLLETMKTKLRDNKFAELTKEKIENVLDVAGKFSGIIRNYGKHASGLVITPGRIDSFAPLGRVKGSLVTMFDMDGIDYIKLVKLDILGSSTLSMLHEIETEADRFAEKHHCNKTPKTSDFISYVNKYGIENGSFIDDSLMKVGLDSNSVYNAMKLFQQGITTGIFQFSSAGMRKMLKKIRPTDIKDLSAAVALYRPGPLNSGLAAEFQKADPRYYTEHGEDSSGKSQYPKEVIDIVRDVAKDARGVTIYQEHIMQIARRIAGYSMGQADILRKAMGKKKPEIMAAERAKFVEGAAANGFSREVASKTFDTIAYFAGYGFNKSHSVCYSVLAFITAWYLANRPALFWSALINDIAKKQTKDSYGREKISPILAEALKYVSIIPPQITGQKIRNHCEAVLHENVGDADRWQNKSAWGVVLGLNAVKRGSASASRIAELGLSGKDDLEAALRKGLYTESESAIAAAGPLFLNGYMDKILTTTLVKFGIGISPIYLRLAILEMGENLNPQLNSAMLSACRDFSRKDLSSVGLPFKIIQSRSVFGSFLDYAAKKLRAKLNAKRPWTQTQADRWFEVEFKNFTQILVNRAVEIKNGMTKDLEYRTQMTRAVWKIEKESFGEGITVPDWGCAAETVGWTFTLFADEAQKYLVYRNGLKYNNLPLSDAPDELGEICKDKTIVILGYYAGCWWNAQTQTGTIKLRGRYGDSDEVLWINCKKRLPIASSLECTKKIASAGNYMAVRVNLVEVNGRFTFMLDDSQNLMSVHDAGIQGIPISICIVPMQGSSKIIPLRNRTNTGEEIVRWRVPSFGVDNRNSTKERNKKYKGNFWETEYRAHKKLFGDSRIKLEAITIIRDRFKKWDTKNFRRYNLKGIISQNNNNYPLKGTEE